MKLIYVAGFFFAIMLFAACGKGDKKKYIPKNKEVVKNTQVSSIDTIVSGKWLPFIPVSNDTLIPAGSQDFFFVPGKAKSDSTFKVDTFTVSGRTDNLIDTVTGLKPEVIVINPEINTAVYPEARQVKDFRSVSNTNYDVQYLDMEQGLPVSGITSVVQDQNGLIWMGSSEGLICYDGSRIYQFRKQNGLPSKYIKDILIDRNQNLWMVSGNRLTMYDGKKFHIYGKEFIPEKASIADIFIDSKGDVWIAALDLGLFRLHDEKIYKYKESEWCSSHFPMSIVEDAAGRMWIGGWGGNMSIIHGDTAFIHKGRWTYRVTDVIMSGFKDSKKNLWFTSYNAGLTKREYGTGRLLTWRIAGEFSPIYHNQLEEDKNGNMWSGSDRGGLVCLKPNGELLQYTTRQGLTDNNVNDVYCDKFGVIWIATASGGLCRMNPESFIQHNDQDGLVTSQTTNVLEDHQHNYYVGTWAAGMRMKYKNQWRLMGADLDNKIILDALEGEDKSLWVSLHNFGLRRLVRPHADSLFHTVEMLQSPNGFTCSLVYDIMQDDEKRIWFCDARQGISRYVNGHAEKYTPEKGNNYVPVYSVCQAADGTVWLANINHGISCVKANKIKHFTTREGLRANETRKIFAGKNGLIWISYADGGFSTYDGKKFTHYSTMGKTDLPNITGFCQGQNNAVWAGTSNGLYFFKPDAKAEGGMIIQVFTIADGAKTNEYSLNTPYMDSKQNLWLNTGKGVTQVKEHVLIEKSNAPGIHIISVSVNGNNSSWNQPDSLLTTAPDGITFDGVKAFLNIPENLALSHNNNNLSFDFAGIQWRKPGRIQYRIRLLGFSDDWSPPSQKSTATFNNLGSGTYTFEVQARLDGGAWSKSESFRFIIHPPWWKTWWFICILIGLGAVFVYAFIRMRTAHLRKKANALEQVVKDRTVEIAEQKKVIEEKQKETVDSINYAKRIQYALLAQDDLLKQNLPEHFVFFLPKDIVSGDFYWASANNNQFYLAVCDSTGHGVPGAFMSLLNISYLNEAINEKNMVDPGKAFDYVRSRLIENISKEGQQDGMDGILLAINKSSGLYSYAAANNPPVVVNQSGFVAGQADKMPVGKSEKKQPFTTHTVSFQKGDMLYLVTDGFADQFGGDKKSGGKKFKRANLYQLMQTICHLPVVEQRHKLEEAFRQWKGDLEQMDDICVVGIRL